MNALVSRSNAETLCRRWDLQVDSASPKDASFVHDLNFVVSGKKCSNRKYLTRPCLIKKAIDLPTEPAPPLLQQPDTRPSSLCRDSNQDGGYGSIVSEIWRHRVCIPFGRQLTTRIRTNWSQRRGRAKTVQVCPAKRLRNTGRQRHLVSNGDCSPGGSKRRALPHHSSSISRRSCLFRRER